MEENFIFGKNKIIIKINKNIYDKEVLIYTTYVLLDKYYFLIDEKENYYLVNIKPKQNEKKDLNKEELTKIGFEFLNELVESGSYIDQLKRTSEIRKILLEKALTSNLNFDLEKDNN